MQRAVRAMSLHGLFAAGEGDSVLLRAAAACDFAGYLDRCGISLPAVTCDARSEPEKMLVPFGWNAEAALINKGRRNPARHPELPVVRKVNSRVYSAEIEKRLNGNPSDGRVCDSVAAVESAMEESPEEAKGWVVKADHGNAALGNRRIRGRKLSDADLRRVEDLFAEDDSVVLEVWHERVADLTAVFSLAESGLVEDFRVHEAVCTSDGALIGVIFTDECDPFQDELAAGAGKLAACLRAEGYFGPVCFDAYTFRENGKLRLRSLVDLNCRRAMSDGAHRLWRERFPGSTFYWRFFTGEKLVQEAFAQIVASDMALRHGKGHGVLLTSPWHVEIDGRSGIMPKIGAAFIGETKAEVLAMEREFRRRWEK